MYINVRLCTMLIRRPSWTTEPSPEVKNRDERASLPMGKGSEATHSARFVDTAHAVILGGFLSSVASQFDGRPNECHCHHERPDGMPSLGSTNVRNH